MNYLVITYLAYIALSFALTIWVGRTLFTHGRVFLLEIFKRDEVLVDSVNKLLLVGFYLINFGYVVRNLIVRESITSITECIEMLSVKIGIIIIVLGIMHFFNLIVLFLMRSKTKGKTLPMYTEEL